MITLGEKRVEDCFTGRRDVKGLPLQEKRRERTCAPRKEGER